MAPSLRIAALLVVMKKIFLASLTYFGLVFAAGFLLGLVRVLFVVPELGERTAELIEMPIMLVVIYFSARFIIKRFTITEAPRLVAVGCLALLILLAVEFSAVLQLRNLTIEQYLTERDPVAGITYLAGLLVFASMPAIISCRRKQSTA